MLVFLFKKNEPYLKQIRLNGSNVLLLKFLDFHFWLVTVLRCVLASRNHNLDFLAAAPAVKVQSALGVVRNSAEKMGLLALVLAFLAKYVYHKAVFYTAQI